jgi:hypothetical protein
MCELVIDTSMRLTALAPYDCTRARRGTFAAMRELGSLIIPGGRLLNEREFRFEKKFLAFLKAVATFSS